MRGADSYNESLFTTVKPEDFGPREMAGKRGLLSGGHFSVDGTLIQA